MSNIDIARKLQEHARELRQKRENLFRIRAYNRAAEALLRLDKPVDELIQQRGRKSLEELPGIGRHIAWSIRHFFETGEWQFRN